MLTNGAVGETISIIMHHPREPGRFNHFGQGIHLTIHTLFYKVFSSCSLRPKSCLHQQKQNKTISSHQNINNNNNNSKKKIFGDCQIRSMSSNDNKKSSSTQRILHHTKLLESRESHDGDDDSNSIVCARKRLFRVFFVFH